MATIYGLIFFTTFIKNTVVGYLTDKFQLHKVILVLSCLLTGPLYCSLVAVPVIQFASTTLPDQALHCVSNNSYSNVSDIQASDSSVLSLFKCQNDSGQCLPFTAANLSFTECSLISYLLTNSSISDFTASTLHNPTDSITKNESHFDNISAATNLPQNNLSPCLVTLKCTSKPEEYTSQTFWICLVVALTAALCGSNEMMLNDAITLTILGKGARSSMIL